MEKPKLNQIGAAWENPRCISIKLSEPVGEGKLVLLKNRYKKSPKQPAYLVFRENEGLKADAFNSHQKKIMDFFEEIEQAAVSEG